MATPETVIFETDTTVDHYAVVELEYEGRPARVLFSGSRRAAQSGIGLDDEPDLLFDYNQRILEVANALYPRRVLVIGGGTCTLPMALSTALSDAVVDVVELDPGLQAISQQYFGLRLHERLRLFFGDGRDFLAKTANRYDLIVVDVYSELSIPQQFLTIEFVELLAIRLTDSGAVAINIIASYQGRNTGLIKSQVAAYRAIFAAVNIFPAAHALTSWLPQNLVLVAQKQPLADLQDYIRFAPLDMLHADDTDVRRDD